MGLDYLGHIRTESQRFHDVLAATNPDAAVPSCPEWSAADLLWHLTSVQAFWAWIVETRAASPRAAPELGRPASFAGLLSELGTQSVRLAAALETADPADAAWTWSEDRTIGFILRRQAHEALIHRLDAELTAGAVTPLPAPLAADGVLEVLDVMYGGCPAWGSFSPEGPTAAFRCTDTGDLVSVQLGRFTGTDPESGTIHDEVDLAVVPAVEAADALVRGSADDLDAWLWHRRGTAGLEMSGDGDTLATLAEILNQPIT